MMRRIILCAALLTLGARGASAQAGRGGRAALREQQDPAGRRQALELQLRRGLWRVAKQRIGFTDQQMTQLEETSRRFDERRRALAADDRAQRATLRREVLADTAANQTRIGAALDRMLQLQRQRVDLQAEEQKEFASFMTPLQRAKYLALQEQLRRRMEALRAARPDSAARIGR